MSTTVDNRVLEMRFDNKQFESGVATSMSTLEKLKQKLNLSGAAKGLDGINKAVKNVNFSGMASGIETVQAKFSALQIAGVTALANITNSAVNAGKRIVSELTIDPLKSGFQEYETQIGAIQTILSNTRQEGTNVDIVNKALDELNTYADKTIYNFTEMTRNIGTFTAAGVKLDTSVNAIKGIANLAAVSGSTSQQASTAMYQLSQALAAGKVSLMDWNSVVNAGMGGKVFQDALIRTSELLGTGAENAIKAYGSFRESLTKGEWLTTEVLTETLNQLSGAYSKADLMAQGFSESQADEIMALAQDAQDAATKVKTFTQLMDTLKESLQSGWSQTWRMLVGDFEESKELFTSISDTLGGMIEASAKSRNEMLEGALSSNWDKLVSKINEAGIETKIFEEKVKSVAESHNVDIEKIIEDHGSLEKAFQEGAISTDILKEAVSGLNDGLSNLSKIQNTLKKGNVGDDVKAAQEALKSLNYDIGEAGADGSFGAATEEAVKAFQEASGLTVDGIIGPDTLSALKEATESTNSLSDSVGTLIDDITELGGRAKLIESFKNIWVALKQVLGPVRSAFRQIFPPATADQLTSLIDKFHSFTERLRISRETAEKIRLTFKGLFSVVDMGIEGIKALAGGAFNLLGKFAGLGDGVLGVTSSIGEFLINIRKSVIEGDLFGKTIDKIVDFISGGIDKIKEFGSSIKESMNVSSTFQGFLGFFKGLWNAVQNISSSIVTAFGSIGNTMSDAFGKGDIFEVLNSGLFAGILLAIRKFVKGLSSPFEKNGFLDNVKNILDGVKGSLEAWQSNLKAETLLKIAGAIGILAAALWVISGIDEDKLGSSLGAIAGLFVELIGALTVLEKINSKSIKPLSGIVSSLSGISRTLQMMGLGTAILILAGAMKMLANLDWQGVAKGLVGIAGLVGFLVGAAKLMNTESKSITKFAGQMLIISAAVVALSGVAKVLASMSWEELAKSGAGILGIVAILVGAAKLMNTESKSITKFAGQMLIMSAAVAILSGVANVLASMNWSELGKAGAGILGIVSMFVAAATIMSAGKGSIAKFGGQMLLMAMSLAILTPVMTTLGSMSWESIGKGLVVIGGALIELSIGLKVMHGSLKGSAALFVAAAGLGVLTPVLMALGTMSWESIAKGLIALAGAFAVIGTAGALLSPLTPALLALSAAMGVFALAIAGIGIGIFALAAGFTTLAAAGATGAVSFVAALTTIITGILGLAPQIAQIIGQVIVEVAAIIGDYAPQLADSFLKLILGVLQSLETNAPQIVSSLLGFIIGVINSLAEHTPELISAVMNFVGQVVKGIVDAISNLDMDSMLKGIGAFGAVGILMKVFAGAGATAGPAMAGVLAIGAVIAEIAILLAAIGKLSEYLPDGGIEKAGDLLESIGNALGRGIGAFIGGIGEGVTGSLPTMGQNIADFMDKLAVASENASGIESGSFDGVSELMGVIGDIAKTTVGTSISDIFTLGGTSMEKFEADGVAFFDAMRSISEAASGISLDEASMMSVISAASSLSALQSSLEPIGGIMDWFTGRDDLGTFGTSVASFMESMKTAFSGLEGVTINSDSLASIIDAATKLSEFQSSLENMGGVIEWFTGRSDLGTFGEKIGLFASAMGTLKTNMGKDGISESVVTSVTNAGNALVALQEALPSEKWFDGKINLEEFSGYIGTFSTAISDFSTKASELDSAGIATAMSAAYNIKYLIEAIAGIDYSGIADFTGIGKGDLGADGPMHDIAVAINDFSTVVSEIDIPALTASITAATTLRNFIVNLQGLDPSGIENFKIDSIGAAMKKYGSDVSGIDTSVVASSISSANRLKTFIASLAGLDNSGVANFKPGSIGTSLKSYSATVVGIDLGAISNSVAAANKIKELISGLAGLDASGVSSFVSSINTLGSASMKGLTEAFSGSSGDMSSVGSDLFGSLAKGMKSGLSSITGAASSAMNAAQKTIMSSVSAFTRAGSTLMTSLADGLNSRRANVSSAVTSAVSSAAGRIASYHGSFYSNGGYLGDGLVSGINSRQSAAYQAGYALGQAAVQGEKDGQASNSPSKLTIQAGEWLGDGLVIGIKKMGKKVYNVGHNLGNTATRSISGAISKVSDLINTGIDPNPTISPVVDLSNVQSSVGAISGMFTDATSSIGVMSNLNAINATMNRRNQNGSMNDVVDAINKMRKDIGDKTLGNTTYSIGGVTYDNGSEVSEAISSLVRALRIEGRA